MKKAAFSPKAKKLLCGCRACNAKSKAWALADWGSVDDGIFKTDKATAQSMRPTFTVMISGVLLAMLFSVFFLVLLN